MGKVIVIEGSDGSGKATQSKLLYEYLTRKGKPVKRVSFPNYESPSSALVKMYLESEFGTDPYMINAYVASSFYAVDRFASYLKDWKTFYNSGRDHIVICDRYVTSNMLHQAAKFDSLEEKQKFLDWEYDFEFIKGGLPVPDYVFFLDVKPETAFQLIKLRQNKITQQTAKDIHEANEKFLARSYENSLYLCEKYRWKKIECCDEQGAIKSISEIHHLICKEIEKSCIPTKNSPDNSPDI